MDMNFRREADKDYENEHNTSFRPSDGSRTNVYWPLAVEYPVDMRAGPSPPSLLLQSNAPPCGSDRERRESLETCALEQPGCYVLVPSGVNASDCENKQSTEDLQFFKEKNTLTKKFFRKPMKDSDREAIKLNRKLGVCLRCKLFKEKCRGGNSGACERCRSLKIWKNICVSAVFTDKLVFNRDIYQIRVTPLIENIYRWDPVESNFQPSRIEVIEVHNGYPPKLRLEAHKFTPNDVTLLEHILWRVAPKPDFRVHPSTCYGLQFELNEQLDEYIDQHARYLIAEEEAAIKEACDALSVETYKAAFHYAISDKPLSRLIQKALRIWIGQTFFFRSSWRLCGHNALGMAPINAPTLNIHGLIPLPRLINQQLDHYLELRIATLEKELLGELQAHIHERNASDWFGIYLTIFIQLSTLERDNWSLHTWLHDSPMVLRRVQMLNFLQNDSNNLQKTWVWPLATAPTILIEKNNHLAQTLVYHFRTVSRGLLPFKLDWDQKQIIHMVGGESEAIEYMKALSKRVSEIVPYLTARQKAEYDRDDYGSLSASFTSKLMVDEES